MAESVASREFGSFRDPAGSVLYFEGEIYRRVDRETYDRIRTLFDDGILQDLIQDRLVVDTVIVDPDSIKGKTLSAIYGPEALFLRHDKIPFVSYPYEWTATMLADAGLLHIELQTRLLKHGYSLKDATAFNVAFVGSQPVFMDIPSIEMPRQKSVWVAYGQFCRMFVYPLLLQRHRGLDLRQCFLGNLDGPSVAATRRMLGFIGSLRPQAFVDVFLQNLLCSTAEKRITQSKSIGLQGRKQDDARPQELNLMRLRGMLQGLIARGATAGNSVWSDYESTKSYTDTDETQKTGFIETFLAEHKPGSVLDLGCNTGRYSKMAVENGARVVAADFDHDSVELLYQSVRGHGLDILPLCVDITNPAPALGFRHQERKSFESRVQFDAVFALALVHHLLVAARIPLEALCDLFAAMTQEWLIIEFVHTDDSMFKRLLATREDLYAELTVERFEEAFARSFELVRRCEMMDGRRVLYLMHNRCIRESANARC